MKQYKRAAALLLASSMLLPLYACGGADVGNDEGTDTASSVGTTTGDEERIEALEVRDLGEKELNILVRTEWEYEFISEGENGDIINDEIFRRNTAIEERYNTKLSFISQPGAWGKHEDFANTIHNSVLAGDGAYDFVVGYQACLPINIGRGDMIDLHTLPYLKLDAPWWTQEGIDALTINGRCYMAGGDIAISLLEGIYCMLFNKTVAAELDTEDFYTLVREGKWTHDKMMSVIRDVSQDLNGDSAMDTDDSYGLVTMDNYIRPYIVTYDTPTLGYADDGSLEVVWYNERSVSVLEKLVDMAHDPDVYLDLQRKQDTLDSIFKQGRTLLAPSTLGKTSLLRDMDDDFGIIPYPKFDDKQESYLTTTSNSVSMIAIPITAPDPEVSALIIEALCRESHETAAPALYEIALKSKYTRDDNSAQMIELIRSTLSFDCGWINSLITGVSGAQYSLMVEANDNNFASWYAANKTSIEQKVKEFSEIYYD